MEIWKRFRKYGGIPTGITQNVKDLLSSREVENIFENSDFIYMLNQAAQSGSNPISRWRQKRNIQKEYAAAKQVGHRVYDTGKTAEYAKEAAKKTKSVVYRIGSYAADHSHVLLIVLLIGGVATTISGAFSSCGAMGSGGTHAILASSFTAADAVSALL